MYGIGVVVVYDVDVVVDVAGVVADDVYVVVVV